MWVDYMHTKHKSISGPSLRGIWYQCWEVWVLGSSSCHGTWKNCKEYHMTMRTTVKAARDPVVECNRREVDCKRGTPGSPCCTLSFPGKVCLAQFILALEWGSGFLMRCWMVGGEDASNSGSVWSRRLAQVHSSQGGGITKGVHFWKAHSSSCIFYVR